MDCMEVNVASLMSVAAVLLESFQLIYAGWGMCNTHQNSLILSVFFSLPLLGFSATDENKFRNVHIWHTKFGMVVFSFVHQAPYEMELREWILSSFK